VVYREGDFPVKRRRAGSTSGQPGHPALEHSSPRWK
jgi:hypothetical protein